MRSVIHDVFTKISNQWERVTGFSGGLTPAEVIEFKERVVNEDEKFVGYHALQLWYSRLEGDPIKRLREGLDHIDRADLSDLVLVNYQKPLIIACCSGDLSELKRVHDLGLTFNFSDPEQGTPLHIAVRKRDRAMLTSILSDPEPCDPNMVDSHGMTSLHLACKQGDIEIIKLILQADGVDLNIQADCGSALLFAAERGDSETVTMLLEAGADAGVELRGSTLLHVAARLGNTKVANALLAYDIDLNKLNTDGQTALSIASKDNDDKMVSLLLWKGADPLKGLDGYTALHCAAEYNALTCFKLLIEATQGHLTVTLDDKSVLDVAQENGSTDVIVYLLVNSYFVLGERGASPLHWACEKGEAFAFKILASYVVDLERRDEYGRTPLHLASEKGSLQIVEYLVDSGADTWAVDNNNETSLHKASSKGHLDIADLLLQTGVDVNAAGLGNATSLHRACANDHFELVKVLLKSGADPLRKDNLGRTAIDIATNHDIIKALLRKGSTAERRHAVVRLHGARKRSMEEDATSQGLAGAFVRVSAPMIARMKTVKRGAFLGRSPLHEAAEKGEWHVVRNRLDHKAKVDKYDVNGDTPLHLAVANGHTEVCEMLVVDGKATLNAKNRQMLTPLAVAAMKGYQTIAKNLLDFGADPHIESSQGESQGERPLQIASREGNEGVVQVLLKRRGSQNIDHKTAEGETALHIAARGGFAGICRALLDKKANPDATKRDGETPIFEAIRGGHVGVIKVLLAKGARKNIKGSFGRTPLHNATLEGSEQMVEVLLGNKANPNAKDTEGATPLYMAVVAGHATIVKSLLKHGADANIKVALSGDTPLHAAARGGNPDIVEMLLQRGAKSTAKNSRGRVPADEASNKEVKDMIRVHHSRRRMEKGKSASVERGATTVMGNILLLQTASTENTAEEEDDASEGDPMAQTV